MKKETNYSVVELEGKLEICKAKIEKLTIENDDLKNLLFKPILKDDLKIEFKNQNQKE